MRPMLICAALSACLTLPGCSLWSDPPPPVAGVEVLDTRPPGPWCPAGQPVTVDPASGWAPCTAYTRGHAEWVVGLVTGVQALQARARGGE